MLIMHTYNLYGQFYVFNILLIIIEFTLHTCCTEYF